MLRCQGIQCRAEEVQADGRADIIAEHAVGVYIFELKVNESAEEALAQVKRKRYEAPYLAGTRPIWLVGLNFDRATHHLADWKLEQVSPERA